MSKKRKDDALEALADLVQAIKGSRKFRKHFDALAKLPENQRKIDLEALRLEISKTRGRRHLADAVLLLRQNHVFEMAMKLIGPRRTRRSFFTQLRGDVVFCGALCLGIFSLVYVLMRMVPREVQFLEEPRVEKAGRPLPKPKKRGVNAPYIDVNNP